VIKETIQGRKCKEIHVNKMEGINRAKPKDKLFSLSKAYRILESIYDANVPCVFISHQKKDTGFASDVADFLLSKKIDVYFDEDDNDLKFARQSNNHREVTKSIMIGINASDYMLVIVSENTYKSLWVPFEIGFAYDKITGLKILRHKEIEKDELPAYLKTTEILNGYFSLERFIAEIKATNKIYEELEKGEKIKFFSEKTSVHPLHKVLGSE
jgi:hypothetical protein